MRKELEDRRAAPREALEFLESQAEQREQDGVRARAAR
jgi:hypothetical protein